MKIDSITELGKYQIGGYSGDARVSYLVDTHSIPVVTSDSPLLSLRMLDHGRIDLWATGLLSGPALAAQHGFNDLEIVYRFRVVEGYLALHPSVSDDLVKKLNHNITLLHRNGTVDEIVGRYIDANSPL